MEPTTMPAIAPPDNPPLFPAAGAALAVELGAPEPVEFVNILPMAVVTGSLTPAQRVSVFENTQQESVEFGELAAQ
jgi:hypothetical protein